MLVSRPVKARVSSHVVQPARHQHLLVGVLRQTLSRGDELGAHIGKVTAQCLGSGHCMSVGHTSRHHDDAVPELTHRPHEGEGIGPSGLAAGAGRQQHQPVDAGRHRLLGVADRGDVGQHQATRILQRLHHRLGRAHRGDHDLRLVAQHGREVVGHARVGPVHDQVGAPRRRRTAVRIGGAPRVVGHAGQPDIEFVDGSAVGGWERADHARTAGSRDECRAGDEEHRRRDQRQAKAVTQGGRQGHGASLAHARGGTKVRHGTATRTRRPLDRIRFQAAAVRPSCSSTRFTAGRASCARSGRRRSSAAASSCGRPPRS